MTGASDTPPHAYYDGRIQQPANVQRACFQGGATYGRSAIGYGDLVLVNNDGALDGLLDYSFAGRPITIRLGTVRPNSRGVPSWVTVVSGVMEQAECSWQRVTIRVRDRQQDLAKPLQQNRYGGTNVLPAGLDGVESDLAGRPKPLVFGRVFNVQPPMVNSARLIYQLHDGLLAAVDAVYDRGQSLPAGPPYASQADMETNPPAAGQYRALLNGSGTFVRLGSTPGGAVTVDATQGATTSDRTIGQLYRAILLRAGIESSDIVAADVAALDAAAPQELGLYAGHEDDESALRLLDDLAGSVGVWFGTDTLGRFRIARIELPQGPSIGTITAADVLRIERVAARDAGIGVPAWKVKLGYRRVYQTQRDLSAAVPADRKGFLAQAYRRVEVSDPAVKVANVTSPELAFDTLLVNKADAEAEAARRLAIYKARRDVYEVRVRLDSELAAVVDLGTVLTLQLDRYGLQNGKPFLVTAVRTDMRGGFFGLTLWG